MFKQIKLHTLAAIISFCALNFLTLSASAAQLPDPARDTLTASAPADKEQSVVLAGGCFWGVQAVFQHVKGVKSATAGYAGGSAANAHYEIVSGGATGHAESVKIIYNPQQVSFGQLLKVYFSVAHDPTELNRQGPDSGTQYRSEIYFTTPEQKEIAQDYIVQLDAARVFSKPIVTKLEPLPAFYPAEDYHQNYATLHPDNPYIFFNDAPKVAHLKNDLPALYVEK